MALFDQTTFKISNQLRGDCFQCDRLVNYQKHIFLILLHHKLSVSISVWCYFLCSLGNWIDSGKFDFFNLLINFDWLWSWHFQSFYWHFWSFNWKYIDFYQKYIDFLSKRNRYDSIQYDFVVIFWIGQKSTFKFKRHGILFIDDSIWKP